MTTAVARAAVPARAWGVAPAPARLPRVAPDVQLEVLDWGGPAGGGSGPPLVFLAGSGNSAHVFDGFAPRFTSRVRVLGISRRGVGASSRPASGYNTATLARDVVGILDTLGMPKATFAAHSFGGSELHALGADHSGRAAGLVYLDAAYDYHALVASPEDRSGVLQCPSRTRARPSTRCWSFCSRRAPLGDGGVTHVRRSDRTRRSHVRSRVRTETPRFDTCLGTWPLSSSAIHLRSA